MRKKEYMKPVIEFDELDMSEQLLAYSVTTTGLGDNDNLTKDDDSGNSWGEAMSRQSSWGEDEW